MIFHSTIDMVYKNRPFNLVEQWFVVDVVVKAKKTGLRHDNLPTLLHAGAIIPPV